VIQAVLKAGLGDKVCCSMCCTVYFDVLQCVFCSVAVCIAVYWDTSSAIQAVVEAGLGDKVRCIACCSACCSVLHFTLQCGGARVL